MSQRHANGASGNGMPNGSNGSNGPHRGHANNGNGHHQPSARAPSIPRGGSPHPPLHPPPQQHPQNQPGRASNGAQNGASSGGAARVAGRVAEQTGRTPSPHPLPPPAHETRNNSGAVSPDRVDKRIKGILQRSDLFPDASRQHVTATISGQKTRLQAIYGERHAEELLHQGVIPVLPETASERLKVFTSSLSVSGQRPDFQISVWLSRDNATFLLGPDIATLRFSRPVSISGSTDHPSSSLASEPCEIDRMLARYFWARTKLFILQDLDFTRTTGNSNSVQVTTLLERRLANNIIGWERVQSLVPGVAEAWTHADLSNIGAAIELSGSLPQEDSVRLTLTIHRNRVEEFVDATGMTKLFGPSRA